MATPIYTASELCEKFIVTSDMLATVERHIDHDGSVFYTVKSEHTDERYEVRFNFKYATFTCTCKAGQNGFIHCKKGYCKHVRTAKAFAVLYKQAENEQARREAEEARKAAWDAQMKAWEEQRDHAAKHGGFSFLAYGKNHRDTRR